MISGYKQITLLQRFLLLYCAAGWVSVIFDFLFLASLSGLVQRLLMGREIAMEVFFFSVQTMYSVLHTFEYVSSCLVEDGILQKKGRCSKLYFKNMAFVFVI